MKKSEFDYQEKNYHQDKKNCLMILPRPIFPLVSGYSNKNYNLIQCLSLEYNLSLIILSTQKLCEEEIAYYKEYTCRVTEIVAHKYENYMTAFWYLLSTRPIQVGYYYKKAVAKYVRMISQDSDIVIASLVRTVKYLEEVPNSCIKIFDMVDSIGLNYIHSLHQTTSVFWKLLYKIEGKRLINYEKEQVAKADCSFFVNEKEENFYSKYGSTAWLPHGVKEELFSYNKNDSRYEKSVAFIGKMDYQPNIDAVKWYIEKVHVVIGKKIPLIIVGAYPTKDILEIAKKAKNVTVTGYCEDPYLYLKSCLAVIAPMQTGGGIQNKVLEGMALGKINVITSLAAAPIENGKGSKLFLVADTAEQYSKILIDVLENSGMYEDIGIRAKNFVMKKFTWKVYCSTFLKNIVISEKSKDEKKGCVNIYRKY